MSSPDSTDEPQPTTESRPKPRRSWWRRWLRRGAIGAAALLLLLVGLYLTRAHSLHPLLRSAVIRFGPALAGYQVELERISGDWFQHLTLEGVALSKTGDPGPLQSAEIDRVEVDLDLWRVIRGDLSGLHEVRVGVVSAEVDLAAKSPEQPAAKPTDPIPDWLPLARVEELNLDLLLEGGDRLTVRGATLTSEAVGAGIAYQLHVDEAKLDGDPPWSSPIDARVHVEDQRVRLDELALHAPIAGRIDLDLTGFKDGVLDWSLDLYVLDGHALASGSLDGSRLEAAVLLEELHLSKVHDLLDAAWAEDLVGEVRLEVDVTANLEDPEATVLDGKLDARAVGWQGRKLDTLHVQGCVFEGVASLTRLEATAGEDRITGTKIELPFAEGAQALREDSTAQLLLEVTDLTPWIHGASPPEEPLPPHHIHLDLRVAGGRAQIFGGEVRVADGSAEIRSGELSFPGTQPDGSSSPGRLLLDAGLAFEDLAPVGQLLGQEDWSGSVHGGLQLEGPLDGLSGVASLHGQAVNIAGFDLGVVELEAVANGRGVRLDSASATTEDLQFSLTGGYAFEDQSLQGLSLDLEITRPHRFAELLAPGGRLTVKVHADGRWSAPTGTLEVDGLDLVAAGKPIEGLTIRGTAADGRCTLEELRCSTPYGDLDASLTVTLPQPGAVEQPYVLELIGLSLTSDEHQLVLEETATLTVDGEAIDLSTLTLAGNAGRLTLSGHYDPSSVQASYQLVDLAPLPFLDDLVPPDTTPILISGAGELQGGRIEGDLRVKAGGGELANLTLSLPFEVEQPLAPGPMSITGHLALPSGRPLALDADEIPTQLHGDFLAELDLSGTWRSVTGSVVVDGTELWLTPEERTAPYLVAPATAQLRLVITQDAVRLEALDLDLPGRLTLRATGSIATGIDVVNLVEAGADPLLDVQTDVDGDLALEDLAWLTSLTDSLRRLEGAASGTLSVHGPLGAPDLGASLRISDGAVKLADAPELERLNLLVELEGHTLTIRDTAWEMGASPVRLAGTVDLGADPIEVDVRLDGEEVLLSRSSSQRLRGNLDLTVNGPLDRLRIGGEIALVSSRLLQEIDFLSALQGGGSVNSRKRGLPLPSFRNAPLSTAEFNLKVTTAEPIRLLSNVARADVRLDLGITGTGEVLVPTGRLFLDDLRCRLPGGTVVFPLGMVSFEDGNPYDPTLEMRGEARLAGYEVALGVSGRLSSPLVDASSDPPLGQDELMLLVLSGQPPATGGGDAAARSLGIYLAQDLAKRWMGGTSLDEDDSSFWNRLEIQTGRDVSKAGTLTLEISYRLRDEYPGPRDAVYLVAERDVYEDYNMGVRFVLRRR